MSDHIIQTRHLAWQVAPLGRGHVSLAASTGRTYHLASRLTAKEAAKLGSALCAAALQAESRDGSVMDAADALVDAADRFDRATGESRR